MSKEVALDTSEVVQRWLHEHNEMFARLAEWEAGLAQFGASGFLELQGSLQRLWKLIPFFEEEVAQHFREEEKELFAAVKARHPRHRQALVRFAADHVEFVQQWEGYKLELLCCDTVATTRRVCALGNGLVRLLRQHMESEEQELLPLVTAA